MPTDIDLDELDRLLVDGALLDRASMVVVFCWDSLCDMSQRAARQLERDGFTQVHDFVHGKAYLARLRSSDPT